MDKRSFLPVVRWRTRDILLVMAAIPLAVGFIHGVSIYAYQAFEAVEFLATEKGWIGSDWYEKPKEMAVSLLGLQGGYAAIELKYRVPGWACLVLLVGLLAYLYVPVNKIFVFTLIGVLPLNHVMLRLMGSGPTLGLFSPYTLLLRVSVAALLLAVWWGVRKTAAPGSEDLGPTRTTVYILCVMYSAVVATSFAGWMSISGLL